MLPRRRFLHQAGYAGLSLAIGTRATWGENGLPRGETSYVDGAKATHSKTLPVVYRHDLYLAHDTGSASMERPERLRTVHLALSKDQEKGRFLYRTAGLCPSKCVERVHPQSYLERLQEEIDSGRRSLSDEPRNTFVSHESLNAALAVSGAAVEAVELLLGSSQQPATAQQPGRVDMSPSPRASGSGSGSAPFVAFVPGRPPGHHAGVARAGGYCLLNHAAVAARHAQALGLERIGILDFDVHHGNGTQEIFYRDGSVFYCSLHQKGLYPMPQHDIGHSHERGEEGGRGANLNIPLSPGTDNSRYLAALDALALPALRRFRPGLLILSAGFDGHRRDPQGGWELTTELYRKLGERVRRLSQDLAAPVLSLLEGGYHLKALGESYQAHFDGLSAALPTGPASAASPF